MNPARLSQRAFSAGAYVLRTSLCIDTQRTGVVRSTLARGCWCSGSTNNPRLPDGSGSTSDPGVVVPLDDATQVEGASAAKSFSVVNDTMSLEPPSREVCEASSVGAHGGQRVGP